MAGNNIVVNETALNEGASRVFFVDDVPFAAAASVYAEITYKFLSEATPGGQATAQTGVTQGHAGGSTPLGVATLFPTSVATKYAEFSTTASATILAPTKPPDGGAIFNPTGTIDNPTAFFISPMQAVLTGTATSTVNDADVLYTRFASAYFGEGNPQNRELSSFFTADPSILADGEVDYQHFVGWDTREQGTSALTFTPGAIKIFSDAWIPFSGATLSAALTYNWAAKADFSSVCSASLAITDQFFANKNLLCDATISLAPLKTAPASGLFSSDAEVVSAIATQLARVTSSLLGSSVFTIDPLPTAERFGGYVFFECDATIPPVDRYIKRLSGAEPNGTAAISSTYFVWRNIFDSPTLSAGATVSAFGSVWGYDIIVFYRSAETKNFVRSAETKNFVRAAT